MSLLRVIYAKETLKVLDSFFYVDNIFRQYTILIYTIYNTIL